MVVIFSNNAHAQELHEKTLYEIANQTPSNETSAIPVGKDPYAIGVNWLTNTVYVGNRGDNTVSVINGMTNTKIKDISVGKRPHDIGINEITNTIYVTNRDDGTVSVIDGKSNNVVTKVIFNVEPFNSGHIQCDDVESPSPLLQQFYLYSGTKCTAKPSQGFEFVNWQQNLKGNSTQL
jgi:YVTN family beta-propeller protein